MYFIVCYNTTSFYGLVLESDFIKYSGSDKAEDSLRVWGAEPRLFLFCCLSQCLASTDGLKWLCPPPAPVITSAFQPVRTGMGRGHTLLLKDTHWMWHQPLLTPLPRASLAPHLTRPHLTRRLESVAFNCIKSQQTAPLPVLVNEIYWNIVISIHLHIFCGCIQAELSSCGKDPMYICLHSSVVTAWLFIGKVCLPSHPHTPTPRCPGMSTRNTCYQRKGRERIFRNN